MPVRSALLMAAAGLALGIAGCSSVGPDHQASSGQVRPAQMTELSQCDDLARQVQNKMPTAKAYRVPYAQKDLAEAQDLCHSGQSEQGIAILQGALTYMDQEP